MRLNLHPCINCKFCFTNCWEITKDVLVCFLRFDKLNQMFSSGSWKFRKRLRVEMRFISALMNHLQAMKKMLAAKNQRSRQTNE
jgi:hypothetical protein